MSVDGFCLRNQYPIFQKELMPCWHEVANPCGGHFGHIPSKHYIYWHGYDHPRTMLASSIPLLIFLSFQLSWEWPPSALSWQTTKMEETSFSVTHHLSIYAIFPPWYSLFSITTKCLLLTRIFFFFLFGLFWWELLCGKEVDNMCIPCWLGCDKKQTLVYKPIIYRTNSYFFRQSKQVINLVVNLSWFVFYCIIKFL